MVEEGQVKKKPRKQKQAESSKADPGSNAQEPTLSRLTARQLAVARLVSSYKYECKKVFKQVLERQEKWKSDVEKGFAPGAQEVALESNEVEEKAVDEAAAPSLPSKRRGLAWKQAEREALKKWFLAFGFGRWREIENGMQKSLKVVRHGDGDIEDACWEFVSELLHNIEGKELEYLTQQLDTVKSRMPIQTLGVPWTKIQSSAKIWTRRLQLLENITAIVEQMKDKEMEEYSESSLKIMSEANSPAPWWNSKTDICLIRGVHKHGYGNYDAVRTDPEFSAAFGQAHLKGDTQVEGTTEADQSKKGAKPNDSTTAQWPATDLLTKRLKRVTEHLNQIQARKQQVAKPTEPSGAVQWSRKDKMEMVKVLMTFGMPARRNHCQYPEFQSHVDWKFLQGQTSLQHHHSESAVQQMCGELIDEAEEVLGNVELQGKARHSEDCRCALCTNKRKLETQDANPGEEGSGSQREDRVDAMDATETQANASKVERRLAPPMVKVLTSQTAAKLGDRLDMLCTLRKGYFALRARKLGDGLTAKTQDLPGWWVAGVHDAELVSGALRHGMGAWVAIERDPSLSFLSCSQLFMLTDKTVSRDCTEPVAEAKRLADVMDVTLEAPPIGGDRILPDSKVLLRRLKQIVALLKKHLRVCGSPPPALLLQSDTTMKDMGASRMKQKRLKYSRNTKVDRDPSGKPVLPLTLTSMLALIDLGRVEWERVAFHSERHIFPIGFKTRRRYSSTIDRHSTTTYTCTILDGETCPLFTIFADDNPMLKIQSATPSGSWADLYSLVYDVKGIKKDKVAINGTDMFGLSHPTISRLIQELPNAKKCTYFIPELSFCPPGKAEDKGLDVAVSGRIEASEMMEPDLQEAMGMDQSVSKSGQWGSHGASAVESHQYLYPGPAAISRQDGAAPCNLLHVHPPLAPIIRKPAPCPTPAVARPQVGHANNHLVPGPFQLSNSTPRLSELVNQSNLNPSAPHQLSAALNRGSVCPQGSSEQVGPSTSVINQQIRYWDVLPQMGGQLQQGGGRRMPAAQLGHSTIPFQFYNCGGAGDVRRVQSGSDLGCDPRVMPASLAHEFDGPQFGFRNSAGIQGLHVMGGDGMRLNAPDRQENPDSRVNMGSVTSNLAPRWPGSLMGGGDVMLPQNSDVHFAIQSNPLQTAEILSADETSTLEG